MTPVGALFLTKRTVQGRRRRPRYNNHKEHLFHQNISKELTEQGLDNQINNPWGFESFINLRPTRSPS